MKKSQQFGIKEVYDLVSDTRQELLVVIKELRTDFLEMEQGRLTRLENQFAEFKGESKVRVATTAGIVSVIVTFVAIAVNLYFK